MNETIKRLFVAAALLAGCQGGAPEEAGGGEGTTGAESATETTTAPRTATAVLEAAEGSAVQGTVTFTEDADGVRIEIHATGLEPGPHGFHVHETGDCTQPDFQSAGPHFAPEGEPHGAPGSARHHAGDFGNVEANADGVVEHQLHSDRITLDDGPRSVIGRAVIVHAEPDDLTSQPAGNAGARLACGVIRPAS